MYSIFKHRYVEEEETLIFECMKERDKYTSLLFCPCICLSYSFFFKRMMFCVSKLLIDERNFHCWNYRRWVLSQLKTAVARKDVLGFTMEKIEQNFSNYSVR